MQIDSMKAIRNSLGKGRVFRLALVWNFQILDDVKVEKLGKMCILRYLISLKNTLTLLILNLCVTYSEIC